MGSVAFVLLATYWSSAAPNENANLQLVVAKLKQDQVWSLRQSRTGMRPDWTSVRKASNTDLRKARLYIERLYDKTPSALPGGEVGGRMMLRYLNARLPKNNRKSQSLRIRAVCVYPQTVSLKWRDGSGAERQYALDATETKMLAPAIRKQMDNWAKLLFDISGGRFSLSCTVKRSAAALRSLSGNRSDGRYWLSPTPAKSLVKPDKRVMLYVFWLPLWGNPPPMSGAANYSKPQGPFAHHYIVVHTTRKRLLDPVGWVNLDGGLPHEFWHYITHLARDNGFKRFIANDDKPGRADWQELKKELHMQGLPVPQYAHLEQYANTFTWTFVRSLSRRYNEQRRGMQRRKR